MDKEYYQINKRIFSQRKYPFYKYCNGIELDTDYYLLQKDYANISFFLVNNSDEEANVEVKEFTNKEDGTIILLCYSIIDINKGSALYIKENILI